VVRGTKSNNEILKEVARADVELCEGGAARGACWTKQLLVAVQELEGNMIGRVGLKLRAYGQVDVGEGKRDTLARYTRGLEAFSGDVMDPGCQHRKLCTYNMFYKRQVMGSWLQLPWYLAAGRHLKSEVVRSVARFRTGSHDLEVERGRFERPVRPFELRHCTI
jgi:hypothetical protein